MMKKLWLIAILTCIMCFSFISCTNIGGNSSENSSGTQQQPNSSDEGGGDSSVPFVETVNVTIPVNPVGYAVTGEKSAVKGEDYQFIVTLARGYEKTGNFAVKVNGTPIIGEEDVYTVTANENLTITVEGIALKTCNVILPTGNGYIVSGATTVQYGAVYEFTVTVDEVLYDKVDFTVKVNGKVVTENEGKYLITVLADNLTITVEGVVSPYIDLDDNEFENNEKWWLVTPSE